MYAARFVCAGKPIASFLLTCTTSAHGDNPAHQCAQLFCSAPSPKFDVNSLATSLGLVRESLLKKSLVADSIIRIIDDIA